MLELRHGCDFGEYGQRSRRREQRSRGASATDVASVKTLQRAREQVATQEFAEQTSKTNSSIDAPTDIVQLAHFQRSESFVKNRSKVLLRMRLQWQQSRLVPGSMKTGSRIPD